MKSRVVIPIMHCFDDRYTAPAAVAFLSMLEHAAQDCFYKLYVVHSDITERHQQMLKEVVGRFSNASLDFIVPTNRVDSYFESVKHKGHFSKEVLFKLTAAEEFPQYSRLVIADVDCLYLDDISAVYKSMSQDENYVAGHSTSVARVPIKWLANYTKHEYCEGYTAEEQEAVSRGVNGCFLIFNLDAMRREGLVKRMVQFLVSNGARLHQMEQDVVNLVCAGHITYLPLRTVACAYLWDVLTDDERPYWEKEVMSHPVQLHYSLPVKPWMDMSRTQGHLWWQTLTRTPFFYEVASKFDLLERKSTFSYFGKIPFLEIWSRGEVTKVRFARFFDLCKAIPFWR